MIRLTSLLLALCLVTKTRADTRGDQEDLVEDYKEMRETLREIFARGVEPEGQDAREALPASRRGTAEERRRQLIATEEELHDEGTDLARAPAGHGHPGHATARLYLNEWVVHLTGGAHLAAAVAKDLGYHFLGQVGGFTDVYRLVKQDHPAIHKRAAPALTRHLNAHDKVVWAEQQFVKERSKRNAPAHPSEDDKKIGRRWRKSWKKEYGKKGEGMEKGLQSVMEKAFLMEHRYNDDLWDHQWYLFDTRTRKDLPKLDLQVIGAWEMGLTGRGVKVQILDDGLEWTHDDLQQNYDPEISTDLNGNNTDPTPRYDPQLSNSHGTRCAGEIAMIRNNRKCGVGIAFEANIGGVRMLDGPVSDIVESVALNYALDKVDVVSCSWGPLDDGKRVEGPGTLAQMALARGIKEGRGGKGTVYVWAAGNGGSVGDNCNCDGYTSSVNTLAISGATQMGKFPWYGELCSSILAAAYSSGAYTDQKIATTDLNNTCTIKFTGTSAAAPLAAGIVALALQANPGLTWRDVQHAVVWSSEWGPLAHNYGWSVNKRGLKINPRFGFGLLSAEGIAKLVSNNWTNVPEQKKCKVEAGKGSGNTLRSGGWVVAEFSSDLCYEVRVLEHVQVVTTIKYSRRGALTITLTSPQGTPVTLLTERILDDSTEGFTRWPFTSVLTWGEDPSGIWILNVSDSTKGKEQGSIVEVELVLYGTTELPQHMMEKRNYILPAKNWDEENEVDDGDVSLSSEHLRSLTFEQLLTMLTKSRGSTLTRPTLEKLLKEGRRENILSSLRAQDTDPGTRQEYEAQRIVDELLTRR